jgi:hypothetical protein
MCLNHICSIDPLESYFQMCGSNFLSCKVDIDVKDRASAPRGIEKVIRVRAFIQLNLMIF